MGARCQQGLSKMHGNFCPSGVGPAFYSIRGHEILNFADYGYALVVHFERFNNFGVARKTGTLLISSQDRLIYLVIFKTLYGP